MSRVNSQTKCLSDYFSYLGLNLYRELNRDFLSNKCGINKFKLKALDLWMAGCMLFVFAAFVEFVVVKVLDVQYQYQINRVPKVPMVSRTYSRNKYYITKFNQHFQFEIFCNYNNVFLCVLCSVHVRV